MSAHTQDCRCPLHSLCARRGQDPSKRSWALHMRALLWVQLLRQEFVALASSAISCQDSACIRNRGPKEEPLLNSSDDTITENALDRAPLDREEEVSLLSLSLPISFIILAAIRGCLTSHRVVPTGDSSVLEQHRQGHKGMETWHAPGKPAIEESLQTQPFPSDHTWRYRRLNRHHQFRTPSPCSRATCSSEFAESGRKLSAAAVVRRHREDKHVRRSAISMC